MLAAGKGEQADKNKYFSCHSSNLTAPETGRLYQLSHWSGIRVNSHFEESTVSQR
jgi:hypothetical protein